MNQALIEKLTSLDADFRYMGLNDLLAQLSPSVASPTASANLANSGSASFICNEEFERRVLPTVLQLLRDANGEVQNMAVKTVSLLTRHGRRSLVETVVDSLCTYLSEKQESTRDIAALCLKSVLTELPAAQQAIATVLVQHMLPKLLVILNEKNQVPPADLVMAINELFALILSRFGAFVPNPQLTHIQNVFTESLEHGRPAVRKRAMVGMGVLVGLLDDQVAPVLVQTLVSKCGASANTEQLKTYIGCLTQICRTSAHRLGSALEIVVQLFLKQARSDDDELKDLSLQGLEVLLYRNSSRLTSHTAVLMELSLEMLAYDPNYAYDDDDEEMEDADDFDADDDELESYSDDEDISWKVRRAAAKTLSALVSAYPDNLAAVLKNVAPVVIRQFKEHEESVCLDTIACFATILKQVSIHLGSSCEDATFLNSSDGTVSNPPSSKKRKTRSHPDQMETDDNPLALVKPLLPKLYQSILRLFKRSKTQTLRSALFNLLTDIQSTVGRNGEIPLDELMPFIQTSLGVPGVANKQNAGITSSSLKMDVIVFLRVLLQQQPAEIFVTHLHTITNLLILCVNDAFYKVIAEGLRTVHDFVPILCPVPGEKQMDLKIRNSVEQLFKVLYERASSNDVDQEVKENAIAGISDLVCSATEVLAASDSISKRVLPLLLDRIKLETTRLVSVRKLKQILVSSASARVDLTPILNETFAEVTTFLRKTHRALRIASLELLDALVSRYGQQLQPEHYKTLLIECRAFTNDADLYLLPLSLRLINSTILQSQQNKKITGLVDTAVRETVRPDLIGLLESPLLFGANSAMSAVLELFSTLVSTYPDEYEVIFKSLLQPVKSAGSDVTMTRSGKLKTDGRYDLSQHALSSVAQCIAVIVQNAPSSQLQEKSSRELVGIIAQYQGSDKVVSEALVYLALSAIGEISRRGVDFTRPEISASIGNVEEMILKILYDNNSVSEDIKAGAAQTLGNLAIGNLRYFLPKITDQLRDASQTAKRRYLLLHALNQIITRYSSHDSVHADLLQQYTGDLWNLLFEDAFLGAIDKLKTASGDSVEGTRNVLAECLGRLALAHPEPCLVDLRRRVTSPSASARALVLAAVKFTLSDHEVPLMSVLPGSKGTDEPNGTSNPTSPNSPATSSASFEALLRPHITEFLAPMQSDDDLTVRRLALSCLHTAIHNKPEVVRETAGTWLPWVYGETKVRSEWIRVVDMGPFKHKVDDGLEIRKTAYECLFALLDHPALFHRTDMSTYLTQVLQGCADPAQEIQSLCHLIVIKLCSSGISSSNNNTATFTQQSHYHQQVWHLLQTPSICQQLVDPLLNCLIHPLKESAVKQEVEKHADVMRGAMRVLCQVHFFLSAPVHQQQYSSITMMGGMASSDATASMNNSTNGSTGMTGGPGHQLIQQVVQQKIRTHPQLNALWQQQQQEQQQQVSMDQ